jgi:LPS sulfotransferase NodH
MFEDLVVHSRIVVIGPQFSGTDVAARMIAHDTGHRYIDESLFGANDRRRFMDIMNDERIVVQCPEMMKLLLDEAVPGVFVVLLKRDTQEIATGPVGVTPYESARITYEYWSSHTKPAQYFELPYVSLARHPLFAELDDHSVRQATPDPMPAEATKTKTSCIVATTPAAGGLRLCRLLERTGEFGSPKEYFNPQEATRRGFAWRLLPSRRGFPESYLAGVAAEGTGSNGMLSARVLWSHQRWLVRIGRAALADRHDHLTRTDAEVIGACLPSPTYLFVSSRDPALQALRWQIGQNRRFNSRGAGAGDQEAPDFQEVRWKEELILVHNHNWEAFFTLHDIDPYRVEYESLLRLPTEVVEAVIRWFGFPDSDPASAPEPPPAPEPTEWLELYRARRGGLRPLLHPNPVPI